MNRWRRFWYALLEREHCPHCGAEFFRADALMQCYDCGRESIRGINR